MNDTRASIASFDKRLKRLRLRTHETRVARRRRPIPAVVALVGLMLFLPLMLVWAGSMFHRVGYAAWTALLFAGVICAAVAGGVAASGLWLLGGRLRPVTVTKWITLPLVAAYSATALLYVAESNVKTAEVRGEYRGLHPVLRLALATLILADDGLVITDGSRTPQDYPQMGLSVPPRSNHYVDVDGYAHAADLRTIGRSDARNWMLDKYFQIMGFRTVRHVGTADHLHVELP